MRRFLKTSREGTTPLVFVKIRGQYKLRPEPAADTIVSLHYYGSEDKMVSDEDENSWAKAAEDAVLYGAAELAADFYEDERLARFEQKSADCAAELRSEEHTSELQSLMRISYAVFCLKKNTAQTTRSK